MVRDPRPHRKQYRAPSGAVLVAGTLAAAVALIAPIVLWKRLGDGNVLGTATVLVAALLLCAVFVRATTRALAVRWLARLPRHVVVPKPPPCHSHDDHRTASGRDRRHPSARPCGPSRCRPRHTSRGPRDVRCHVTARSLERRSARRRTRP